MWQIPIYDRTAANVAEGADKCYLNAETLNRIEGNTAYMASLLGAKVATRHWEATDFLTRSEMERIWQKGNVIVFDVDVIGGLNLKRIFGDRACAIFIMPPSIETLRERLVKRGTDSPETIECRVAKAEFELTKAPKFDHVVINDDLAQAIEEATRILSDFLAR